MRYDKPHASFAQQIALLQSRGMLIDDPSHAAHSLAHLNYYRLVAYWLPFEEDHATHRFRPGTRFSAVLNLYEFDRKLRLLVLDAIERVEVSLRTQWAYYLSREHGSHAYMHPSLFVNSEVFQENLNHLRKSVGESHAAFVKHYRDKYTDPDLPPIWDVCELLTFGALSKWYANLRPMPIRRAIAFPYHLDDDVLQSFLRHLNFIRNDCAHHHRLWNRSFTFTMKIPQTKPKKLVDNFCREGSRKIYNALVMLAWMMDLIQPHNDWKERLLEMIEQHAIEPSSMGFPADYRQRLIWQPGWSSLI
ncbi:Abi family protein [Candidatus Magnetaquicoccus inordinatus]|uniref:Abi family protein n=1 Tax=Candidatus Magnetaquicoccus inordinatus TaxID=2496818 RepID=UPI00102B45E8|nr:Abi family protein [Candidatus Magnetaquicoccus inordinatus]